SPFSEEGRSSGLDPLAEKGPFFGTSPLDDLLAEGDLEVGCAGDFGHGIDYDADDLGRLGLGDEGEERPELGQEALEVVGPAILPEEVCKVVDGLFFDAQGLGGG
ncbi:long-chain fatty acid transport protein, partial [Striga asiatica]